VNVLRCTACGRRLTEPVRLLDEMPGFPPADWLPDPGGNRQGPPSVPRGTYVADPLPHGTYTADSLPHGTYVLHPDDVVDIAPHSDVQRLLGCCGPSGHNGINHVCPCGAEVAIVTADCCSRYETRLVRDAVRAEAAP
jgi:hypothetical protein